MINCTWTSIALKRVHGLLTESMVTKHLRWHFSRKRSTVTGIGMFSGMFQEPLKNLCDWWCGSICLVDTLMGASHKINYYNPLQDEVQVANYSDSTRLYWKYSNDNQLFAFVCVCVCVRERPRDRERGRGGEIEIRVIITLCLWCHWLSEVPMFFKDMRNVAHPL